jgi:hypothetical protein
MGLDLADYMSHLQEIEDPLVQMEYLKKLVSQHEPFTLQGGGLFHLSFGAILTGSALGSGKLNLLIPHFINTCIGRPCSNTRTLWL